MKGLTIAIALALLASVSVSAKPTCKKQTIEDLVKAVAQAYAAKDLGRRDAERPYLREVRVVIRHSLGEGADEYESRRFRSLRNGERWLRSREIAGVPGRAVLPFLQCKGGVCTYDFAGGIVHRVLYLEKITYGYSKGCPYLKTIHLLDGD